LAGFVGGLFGYRREMTDSSLILMRLGVVSVVAAALARGCDSHTVSDLRAPRAVSDFCSRRCSSWPGAGDSLAAFATSASESNEGVVDRRSDVSILSAVYGGYFGAGQRNFDAGGDGPAGMHDIHRANGIKNFLGILHQQHGGV